MVPLFGLAGPAEADALLGLMIGYGSLLLVAITSAIGLFARSRVAAGTAVVLAACVTLLFMPWRAFWPIVSEDPDVHTWVRAFRMFGGWWIIAVVGVVASALRAFGSPAKPLAHGSPPSSPTTGR